jgi:hypothetical protein
MRRQQWKLRAPLIFLTTLLFTVSARGQQIGHYLQGFGGLSGGTLAPPGYYIGTGPYLYFVDSLVGPRGGSVPNNLTVAGALTPVISAVAKTKFLGADYGFAVIPTITKQRISTNLIPSGGAGVYGAGDFVFIPVELGWHKSKADFLFTYTIYAPTGDYSSDQVFNKGLGMWTHQIQLGTTYYLDKTKKWNASLLTTWEVHSKKTGTNIRPGPYVSLPGERWCSWELLSKTCLGQRDSDRLP